MRIRSRVSWVLALLALFPAVAIGQESNPDVQPGIRDSSQQRVNPQGTVLTRDQQIVKQVQQALSSRGYSPGPADGRLNSETQNALKEFQKEQGLQPSGRLDEKTAAILGMTWSGFGGSPSSEQNKALTRRFYEEVWGKGNLDVADEIFANNSVSHDVRPDGALPGPAGQKKIVSDLRAAFPDLTIAIDVIAGDDELVAARWTIEGTNTGDWGKIPATGKNVRFSGINIFRFINGQVVEMWNNEDDLGLIQQLGVPINAGSKR